MPSYVEQMKTYSDQKLRSLYRMHMGFAVGFAVLIVLIGLAAQSIVIPGLLGLVIIIGNGYRASQCKQEIDRRAGAIR